MTSRRLLRIKVLQLFYAFTKKENPTLESVRKDLRSSISKTSDLSYEILLLIIEIRRKAEKKIEIIRNRKNPSTQDLNPNLRFVENSFLNILETNNAFQNYINTNLISWNNNTEIVNYFYNKLIESPTFQTYMNKAQVDFNDHKQLALYILSDIIVQDKVFFQTMEDKNIYWNDDYEFVLNKIYKSLTRINESNTAEDLLFDKSYKKEDEVFALKLMSKLCLSNDKNMEIITYDIHNWELDRVSEIDKIIMSCAITELKNFPSIPIKVTLDEYIDISKSYSSAKSCSFINGVLDNVVNKLKANNEIIKTGRGLIDNTIK